MGQLLKEIIIAFESYGKAHRFIVKNRLWKWIIIPGLVYMLLFVASIYLFWTTASWALHAFNTATGLHNWLDKMNSGWVSFLVSFAELIITLLLLMVYFSFFKYIWLILGSPVFSYLSEKTESILDNKTFPFSWNQLLKDSWRGAKLAIRNTLWQTVYLVAIVALSFVPVLGWAAPVLALFVECYYYGFSMLDYSCERHHLSPQASIQFVNMHKGLAIGNGVVFYLLHLVPLAGWVFAPTYAVVAATISLYHEKENY